VKKSKKEIKRFLIAGSGAVLTDFVTYYLMLNFLSHNIAKTISFLLGTVVAFILNKYWTFENKQKSFKQIIQFLFLYMLTLTINIFTNSFVLNITGLVLLSFVIATGVSTILNFIGQKWWVFK
jgi:putative flippase GtrA